MNPYFQNTILNAEPVELIRMIYQQAISSVREAREHLRQRRISERSAAIMRAYMALTELLAALRPETAPEISAQLQSLYGYMLQRLLDANMQQADEPLAEVLGLLSTLSEAWAGAASKLAPRDERVNEDLSGMVLDTRTFPGWGSARDYSIGGRSPFSGIDASAVAASLAASPAAITFERPSPPPLVKALAS